MKEVVLHVYDVTNSDSEKTNDTVVQINRIYTDRGFGGIIFHSAVQVYGEKEWSFRFCENGSGVFNCPVSKNPMYTYRERIVLGETECTIAQVNRILRELRREWPGCSYNFISRNCNHFCDLLCERLGVPKLPVTRLTRLQRTSRVLSNFVDGDDDYFGYLVQTDLASTPALTNLMSSAPAPTNIVSSHCSPTPDLAFQSDYCPQILLGQKCSIGYESNPTSATLDDGKGLVLQVSFKIGDPPSLSRCLVHSYDLTGSRLAREPDILGTAGSLVLLSIHFSGNKIQLPFSSYFVYRAGPGIPSIYHIPGPYSGSELKMAAILPLPDDNENFAVVFPTVEYFMLESRKHYTLHIYRSDTKIWYTKVALFAEDTETQTAKIKLLFHNTTSVVYAGAGLIGWVDLWWGILLCNVLDEKPVIRFIPLPVPELWETLSEFSSQFEDFNPRPHRHMAVYNGVIKFIELRFHVEDTAWNKRVHDQGWMATTWTRSVSSDVWHEHSRVDTSEISAKSSFLHVWPEIYDDKKILTWKKIISGGPTLSMLDDIVYIMAKVDLCHPTTFILAVDTRKSTLQSCVECSAEEMLGLEPKYVLCGPSSFFSTTAELT